MRADGADVMERWRRNDPVHECWDFRACDVSSDIFNYLGNKRLMMLPPDGQNVLKYNWFDDKTYYFWLLDLVKKKKKKGFGQIMC